MDYSRLIDAEVLAFIDETQSFYGEDITAEDWAGQRRIYNAMASHFHAGRPEGLAVCDERIDGVPVRRYGAPSEISILYAHGGGFVLGGLDSHDDVCAEIAAATGRQVISLDYRLAPEHPHPAAYEDMVAVAGSVVENGPVILCGDSAGAALCAAYCGTIPGPGILAQVLIYPFLGFPPEGGSFDTHAHAPLLSRDDMTVFAKTAGGDCADPRFCPAAGDLSRLPKTFLFAAEYDPLCDDAVRYRDAAVAAGAQAVAHIDRGLVHGWLRARHRSRRAAESFRRILECLSSIDRRDRLTP